MACCIPQRIINPRYRKHLRVYASNSFDDLVRNGVNMLKNDLKNGVSLSRSKWRSYSSYIFKTTIDQYADRDDFYIDVPCGRCINCLRSRQTHWRIRLLEEYKYMSSDARANSFFVTLTIAPKYYDLILKEPQKYIRRFLDRVRKKCGKSPRHFIVTEFGENTDRYHFHALFFDFPADIYMLEDLWKYGFVNVRQLTDRRVNYITSYITKHNTEHVIDPKYVEQIFVSPGLGKAYCDDVYNQRWHRRDGEPIPIMINDSGMMQLMPRYFRHKIFTDEEIERLQIAYFANLDEGVIPDPPYYIGKKRYSDYTLYLADCDRILQVYKMIYRKPKLDKSIL